MKETWNLVNEIIGRKNNSYIPIDRIRNEINNTIVSDTFKIANEFNYYFNTVGINIAKQINDNRYMKLNHNDLPVGDFINHVYLCLFFHVM